MEVKLEPLQTEEYDRRRKVWETIKTLVKSEQEELYRILKRGNFEVTENTNGVFFDLSKLPQPLFEQIMKFIEFCTQNRVRFEERDKEMDSLRTL